MGEDGKLREQAVEDAKEEELELEVEQSENVEAEDEEETGVDVIAQDGRTGVASERYAHLHWKTWEHC